MACLIIVFDEYGLIRNTITTILSLVNIKYSKLLHYVLIVLLMIAPLRGVVAAHCEMEAMNTSSGAVMHGTMAHGMSAMHPSGSMPADMSKHQCCDDTSINCSIVCDLGLSFTLVPQATTYSPAYKISFKPDALSSTILFRELTPPSRPPAILHS